MKYDDAMVQAALHCCDQIRTPGGISGTIREGVEHLQCIVGASMHVKQSAFRRGAEAMQRAALEKIKQYHLHGAEGCVAEREIQKLNPADLEEK